MNRRSCLNTLGACVAASASIPSICLAQNFHIDFVLASTLYGNMSLSQILPEVEYTGAVGLDIWDKPFGTQRKEMDQIGVAEFKTMLKDHNAKLSALTCFPRNSFELDSQFPIAKELGAKYLISGSKGPKNVKGKEARAAVQEFIVEMLPHADAAQEHGVVIGVQNQPDSLFAHPDAIRSFAEYNRHPALGIALAPHYLRDHTQLLPELILELGNENLPFIYFQEYGDGAYHKLENQLQLEQLPGRGPLDYSMIVRALKYANFNGVAEVCMYTTPRGKAIDENSEMVTELINEAQSYIDGCVRDLG